MINNYIVDENKFKLAGPPQWFLRKLWDFDNSLVIVPSRQGFYYRLAQRRKVRISEDIVNSALFNESDTKMLARYSLIPVTTILATARWDNPLMFEELRARAPWRQGGADAYNKALEEKEFKEEMDKRAKMDEDLAYLGKDAWKYYLKRLGVRSHLYSPATKDSLVRQEPKKTPDIRTSNKSIPNVSASSIFIP